VPSQPLGSAEVDWTVTRMTVSTEPIAVRASKRLVADELLFTSLGGGRLRLELDRVPLWRGNHVPVRQLIEDFGKYLYLPRLRDHAVLELAVVDGVRNLTWREDTFALAEAFDEAKGRYLGLKAGQAGTPTLDGSYLVVKADVAATQIEADQAARSGGGNAVPGGVPGQGAGSAGQAGTTGPPGAAERPPARKTHFFGTVQLNPLKVAGGAQQVADEVIRHLNSPPGAKVHVRLEIGGEAPEGYADSLVRDIMENVATLKFTAADFEEG
jgi:hypothetical protein